MFVYINKKIPTPGNVNVSCVSCINRDHEEYIAFGGDDGFFKIIKFDEGKDAETKDLAPLSKVTLNQSLKEHSGKIQMLIWNGLHDRLISSDQNGLIIVWSLYKRLWSEEMNNHRTKSVVQGMAWNTDGQRICIANYEDGKVVVADIKWNLIWNKELTGLNLTGVEWSPDSSLLLFSLTSGEVHVYDNTGGFVSHVNIQCIESLADGVSVVGLKWYNGSHGYIEPDCPALGICYNNGRMQIMRNENDDQPIVIDTKMTVVECQWNHTGSVIAIAGSLHLSGTTKKDCNAVQFWTPFGEHLRTVKVPGNELTGCSWAFGSLRIALAVDSFIYFADFHPDYCWCYFDETIVYSYNEPESSETCVMFWDTKNNEKYVKHYKYLKNITSYNDHCVLSAKTGVGSVDYILILCNSIGNQVDRRHIGIEPHFIAMTSDYVIAASKENFLLWNFRSPTSHSSTETATSSENLDIHQKTYHVDEAPTEINDQNDCSSLLKASSNPICCICASEKMLVIGRESGEIQSYTFPHIVLTSRSTFIACTPQRISLNCNSSRLAIIDINGLLNLMDLERLSSDTEGKETMCSLIEFEWKSVWDIIWAKDNPEFFAIMKKYRMYVFKNMDPEEPIVSSGHLCSFKDQEIKAVLLNEVLKEPESPSMNSINRLEVKTLRETNKRPR